MLEHYPNCPYFDNRRGYKLCTAFTNGCCSDHDCMYKRVSKEKEKQERIKTLY